MALTKITQYLNDGSKKLKDSKNEITKRGKIGGGWGWRRDSRALGKDLDIEQFFFFSKTVLE